MSGNIGLGSQEQLLEELTAVEQQRSNQRHGSLIESLIELEESIRVLVIGIRGKVHENQPDKIGAKLESIIRSLHKPILVVNEAFKAPQRIMIAYDGSEAAEKAVDIVANSPLYKGLTCHLISVGKNDDKGQLLESAAGKLLNAGGINVVAKKLAGKPEQVLCEYQQDQAIDMTVMGAFSHTRIHDLLLGSFTARMLMHSQKPLLLLR